MTKKKEETALTKSDTQAMTAPAPNPYDSDVQVQRLAICQPTSQRGEQGNFIVTATEQLFESITIVPLKYKHGRVWFDKDDLGSPPICASDDGFAPSKRIETPYNDVCAEHLGRGGEVCDAAKWRVEQDKKTGDDVNKPPHCPLGFDLVAISNECGPVLMSFRNTGAIPFKGLITFSKYQATVRLELPFLYNCKAEVSLERKTGKMGVYYICRFKPESLTADEVQEVEPLARQLAGYDVGEHYEAEAKASEDGDDIPF